MGYVEQMIKGLWAQGEVGLPAAAHAPTCAHPPLSLEEGPLPAGTLQWFLPAAALTVLAYLLSARSMLDQDVFIMAEIAQRLLSGARLYADIWDNKPPLTLLIYALPQLLFFGSYAAIQGFLGILACLQAWLWLRYAPGPLLLRCGGALFLAWFPLSNFAFAWFSSEDTANLFVLPLLLCAYRAWQARRMGALEACVMGACLVLAFHARQTSILFAPLLALVWASCWPLATPRARVGSLLWLVFGGLLALALVVGLMLWVGDLQGYVNAVFFGPKKYSGSWRKLIDLVSVYRTDVTTFLLTAALLYLLSVPRQRWFALAVAVATLGSILLPKRDHLHYWEQIGPGLMLLVHMAGSELARRDPHDLARADTAPEGARVRLSPWLLAAGVLVPGFVLLNAGWTLLKCALSHDMQQTYAASRALEGLARRGDRLLVIGEYAGPVYFTSSLPHAHKYFWEFYWYGVPEVLPDPIEGVLSDYRKAPPELLAVDRHSLSLMQAPESAGDNAAVKLVRRMLAERPYKAVVMPAGDALNLSVFQLQGTRTERAAALP
jgi:hypothetical protein